MRAFLTGAFNADAELGLALVLLFDAAATESVPDALVSMGEEAEEGANGDDDDDEGEEDEVDGAGKAGELEDVNEPSPGKGCEYFTMYCALACRLA